MVFAPLGLSCDEQGDRDIYEVEQRSESPDCAFAASPDRSQRSPALIDEDRWFAE